jgi:hypothetical protein
MAKRWHDISTTLVPLGTTTPSLNVNRPESVSVRETRFSRDKHLGTEGVCLIRSLSCGADFSVQACIKRLLFSSHFVKPE